MFDAVKSGQLEKTKEFIERDHPDINAKDKDTATLLHWAAYKGFTEIALYLISKGADKNATTDTEGQTPLHWAAISGSLPALHLLVKEGADLFKVDNRGYNIVHHAVQHDQSLCAFYGLHKGFSVDARDKEGHTALQWAAYQGFEDLVRFLISQGAAVNAADATGRTALHWAASRGCFNAARILLATNADPKLKTDEGETAEQLAAKFVLLSLSSSSFFFD